jgi:TolB-like protein/Tfp pilus assembly protein PilF
VNAEKPGFFDELRRRHVWRVAVAYAIAGWLIVQIATQVFPFFKVPDWTVRLVVILLVIGFPVAVLCAWVYELTPEGIRRTVPAASPEVRGEHAHRDIGRKLNTVIIAVLVLAVALMGWRLLTERRAPSGHTVAAQAAGVQAASTMVARTSAALAVANAVVPAPAASVPEKSVAVLPFKNDSGEKSQQYFSDGLSQDLITALTQFAGLKVISRDSAFQFRGSRDSPAIIAAKLGVAHLLEGSVQHQEDEVRISVTLVNASDGSTLWSQHYDKPYKDLFVLQDAITQSVADALKAKLLTTPGAVVQSDRPPSGNLEAWQAYQQGKFYAARNTQADTRKAIDAYTAATRLDPRYAAAYAQVSIAWNTLAQAFLAGAAQQQAYARARAAADTALQLAPDSALAHRARGHLLQSADFDLRGAQAEYQRAAQLAPNDPGVLFNLAAMDATLGRMQQAVALTRKAIAADPLHATWYAWLGVYLSALGQLDAAQQAIAKSIELQPAGADLHEQQAVVAILRAKPEAALAVAQRETDPGWREIALALALQIGPDHAAADAALKALIDHQADAAPYQIAEVYALRHDPDNMFKWLDRAWIARDPGIGGLLYDPFILRYRGDPRFTAFCKKVGLPTTTDAVAAK